MNNEKPYPNLKDYRRRKRSYRIGKNIRLSEKNLDQANPEYLVRLAKWLNVLPQKSNILFEREWIQKIRCAIAREEKRLFRLPSQGREEKKMISKVELIKNLRSLTNAPLKDCQTALEQCENNLDRAVDWLKVKGLNAGGKVVQDLTEGRIAVFVTQNSETMVQINCQTDFGAKSGLVEDCLGEIANAAQLNKKDFSDLEKELTYKLRESVKIKVHVEPKNSNEYIACYVHSNRKIGVLLKVEDLPEKSMDCDEVYEKLCMQIAATNCVSIYPENLPKELVDRQKTVFEEQVKVLKKSEMASQKILEGKMNAWYAEVCLMKQGCVWQPKLQVENYLREQEKVCGHPIALKNFVKFSV